MSFPTPPKGFYCATGKILRESEKAYLFQFITVAGNPLPDNEEPTEWIPKSQVDSTGTGTDSDGNEQEYMMISHWIWTRKAEELGYE